MKILVVDDEKLMVRGIKYNLVSEGYQVEEAYDGLEGLACARNGGFDLIILDLMLPKMSGLEVCMHIRETSKVPIIILTARSDDVDKIIGFEYGADDYITKPFNLLELKARVRALLRRAAFTAQEENGSTLSSGDLLIDCDRRMAYKNGVNVDLTGREFDVIELLMKNPGQVYGREELLRVVWGGDFQGDIRTVDVHIHRLREKLERNPSEPEYIITKWGVGYYFRG